MKLQITLDILELDEAMDYLEQVAPYADIVEVGTPLSLMYGVKAVQKVKEKYPELLVLDDIKLCDGRKAFLLGLPEQRCRSYYNPGNQRSVYNSGRN